MTEQPQNDQFHASSFMQGHNAEYLEQVYARYANDPSSVDELFAAASLARAGHTGRLWRRGLGLAADAPRAPALDSEPEPVGKDVIVQLMPPESQRPESAIHTARPTA